MTAPRVVSIIAILGISTGLYAFLDQARNDVAFKTRSVIKQVQKAHAVADEQSKAAPENTDAASDAFLAATERLARAQQRMFMHLHHPERHPDTEMTRFDALLPLLRRADPDSVKYSESQPKSDPAAHKRVELSTRDADGERFPLTIEWVRYRGGWYVDDFHHRDEDVTIAR